MHTRMHTHDAHLYKPSKGWYWMDTQEKLKIIDEKIIALLHEIEQAKGIDKNSNYDSLLKVYLNKKKQLESELK